MTAETVPGDAEGPARRPHWLENERVLLYPALILLTAFLGLLAMLAARVIAGWIDPASQPLGNDFIAFWSAARLAVEGRPAAAYDMSVLTAVHQAAIPGVYDFVLPWHYPPTFLLVVYPLGLFPYFVALGLFLGVMAGFWAVLIRRMFADPRAWAVAAAFPAGLWNLAAGQNGFLTAGLAGFAFLALDRRRPLLAGALIGLLAIKPHLAALFPLALLAERQWRSLAAAAVTVVVFSALSVAAFGWSTTAAFLHDLTLVPRQLENHEINWLQVPSVCVAALSLGLAPRSAAIMHGGVALAAAICVWFAWRAETAPAEAKFATLSAASLLVSPYVFYYDLTWTGLAIAWLALLGLRAGFRRGQREFLAAAWLASGLAGAYNILDVQLGLLLPLALTAVGTWYALSPRAAAGDPVPAGATIRG